MTWQAWSFFTVMWFLWAMLGMQRHEARRYRAAYRAVLAEMRRKPAPPSDHPTP
jgi:hypothetical protein